MPCNCNFSLPEFDLLEKTPIFVVFVILLQTFTLFSFPVYIFIFFKNRKNEKNKPISQISNHIFKSLVFMYFSIFITCCGVFLYFFLEKLPIFELVIAIALFGVPTCTVIFDANNFILSIFAIQKYLFHFFPKTENYLKFSDRFLKWFSLFIILVFVIKNVAPFYIWDMDIKLNSTKKVMNWMEKYFNSSVYIFINLLSFVSMILIYSIFIDVRELKKLNKKLYTKKSQVYLFWQLAVIFTGRLTQLPFLYYYLNHLPLNQLINTHRIIDLFMTPFLYQVAYIGCNRAILKRALSCRKRVQPILN
ncbi:hypothetical protein CAEBREN_13671 [Caenorhabditis brenneri]|uniref:Serpentine receptor class gamma n=1 Tax=Caenorhabditis brenneri TaxID=135651 RepID=G0N1D6_CAEBE|nr:hypothetical protein CAEBREN_13671 [Caenorhabditis brenneri]